MQRDFWRLLAFAAVSHLSLIVLGIYGFTFTGSAGAVYQILNHELSMPRCSAALARSRTRYATSQIASMADWQQAAAHRDALCHLPRWP